MMRGLQLQEEARQTALREKKRDKRRARKLKRRMLDALQACFSGQPCNLPETIPRAGLEGQLNTFLDLTETAILGIFA